MPNSPLKKWAKISIPLLLGAFFLWYFFQESTAAERQQIWVNVKQADVFWVTVSVALGLLSHLIRANRWKLLLSPLNDEPKLANCFFAVMFGYLANLGVPRSGEVLRGATYASYTRLSFEQSFGTIITERVIDFIMLISIVGIALLLQTDQLVYYLQENDINPLNTLYLLVPLLLFIVFGIRLLKYSQNKLIQKLRDFLLGLLDGIKSVFKLKKRWSFVIQTFAIWILYFVMFWVIKFSVIGAENISIGATLIGFIAGAFSMSITSGGIVLYPLAIASVFKLYDVPVEVGQAFGWVIWTAQTLMVVFVGTLSAVLLPILNKKS